MRRPIILGAMLLTITGAHAAAPDADMQNSTAGMVAHRSYHFASSADHVRIADVDAVSGDDDEAIVTVVIDPGYHINANPASLDYLIPTTLSVTNRTPLRVVYPRPVRFKPKFTDQVLNVYEGTVRIIAEFSQGSLGDHRLFGTVTAQACTEEICLPPADLPLPNR